MESCKAPGTEGGSAWVDSRKVPCPPELQTHISSSTTGRQTGIGGQKECDAA